MAAATNLWMRKFGCMLLIGNATTFATCLPSMSLPEQQVMHEFPAPRKSPDGLHVAAVSNQTLILKTANDGKIVWTYPQDNFHIIWGVSWSPDSKRLAVADAGVVRVLDAADGHQLYIFGGIKGDVFAPDWSANGKYLVAIGTKSGSTPKEIPRSVIAWDAVTQKTLVEISGEPGSTVLWAPDSKRLAFNSDEQNVQIWDALNKEKLATIPVNGGGRPPLNWSPDGRYVVIADWNVGAAVVYESETGKPVTRHP
jgi:WD40 repeat protein